MIFKDKASEVGNFAEELDELDEALTNFRLSVHAWSESAFSRPRSAVAPVAPRRIWRLALGLALSFVLVAGGGFREALGKSPAGDEECRGPRSRAGRRKNGRLPSSGTRELSKRMRICWPR